MQDARFYALTDKTAPWAARELFDGVEDFSNETFKALFSEVALSPEDSPTVFVAASVEFDRVERLFGPFRVSNNVEPTSADLIVISGPEVYSDASLFRVVEISAELNARLADEILERKAAENADPITEARFDRAVARARSLSFE